MWKSCPRPTCYFKFAPNTSKISNVLTFTNGWIDFILKINNTDAVIQTTSSLCLYRRLRIFPPNIAFEVVTILCYFSSLWAIHVFLKSIWTLNFNNTTNRILNAYQNSLLFKDVLKRIKVKIFVMQIDILPQICCLVIFKVLHICNQSKYLKVSLCHY